MTTDPPALLCWLLAVSFASSALIRAEPRFWLGFGISVGFGILAKYTLIILLPIVLLFLICSSSHRWHFRNKFFWFGIGSLLIFLAPVLIWNSQNEWVSFLHNSSHFTRKAELPYRLDYVAEFLAAQLGLVGPVFFILMLCAVVWGYQCWRKGDELAGFHLFCFTGLLVVCVFLSLTKRVYANWAFPAYCSGIFLVAHLYVVSSKRRQAIQRWFSRGLALNVVIMTLATIPLFGQTFGVPGKILPTKKLVGWNNLGEQVSRVVLQQQQQTGDMLAIASDNYGVASELSFYVDGHPRTYGMSLGDRRMNQYDLWGGWQELKGRDILMVIKDREDIGSYSAHFAQVERLTDVVETKYGGDLLHKFTLFIGRNYDGIPSEIPIRF